MASSGPQSVDASGLASGLPTAVGDGWYLVGHMTNAGGMFDGNSNLSSTYSYGNYSNNPYGTSDFYRSFPVNLENELLGPLR
jgi:hypothetical protein